VLLVVVKALCLFLVRLLVFHETVQLPIDLVLLELVEGRDLFKLRVQHICECAVRIVGIAIQEGRGFGVAVRMLLVDLRLEPVDAVGSPSAAIPPSTESDVA
jgi:hypothetical protein